MSTPDTRIVFYLLCAVNAAAFLLYGIDKYKARHRLWRVPESTLLLIAALGGSAGALAGMYLFRHKTKKPRFYLGVPALLLLQLLCFEMLRQIFP